ncbi:Putative UDP-glucosyltransferase YjiC, partial [Durusdinium trenchii]
MPSALASALTLVTTAEFLADPMPADLEKAYDGHEFLFLGPLLDKPGAKRAAGHKFGHPSSDGESSSEEEVLALARAAKAEGRLVILVSLGTVITGDHVDYGWNAHCSIDGEKRGLSGKENFRELCQSAWQAAFDVFGTEDALILLALGPQADALDHLQVDLLRLGVDVFLTHGGQNSFMEALSTGVPMV